MEKNIAIKIENVEKSFRLPTEQTQSLRTALVNAVKGIKGYTEQHVLKDISFEIEKGDFFGIVGKNGSGKSTLLKIISQIYVPEKGSVQIDGKLVSFIELGVGFNPELTGRENVYLNGAMLGFSTKEIDNMYGEIVDFAELHEFMNQKLKNYSSGMQVRLAFSVAIKSQSDILVLDEILAVGDEAFQKKCSDYFRERKDSGKTTILVTHDMNAVKSYCNKAVLIENGLIKIAGKPDDVASQYSMDNFSSADSSKKQMRPIGLSERVPFFEARAIASPKVTTEEFFEVEFTYELTEDIPVGIAASLAFEQDGTRVNVIDGQNREKNGRLLEKSRTKGRHSHRWKIPISMFKNGNFCVHGGLFRIDGENAEMIAFTGSSRSANFLITQRQGGHGLLQKEYGEWSQAPKEIEKKVSIVIPVYKDEESLGANIQSMKQYYARQASSPVQVFYINDCSPDADELEKKIKKEIEGIANFHYARNEENLGFGKTCNNAFFKIVPPESDCIFLNSDTIVTEGFVEEMMRVLYDEEEIGLVCPRSNNASIFSVPTSMQYKEEMEKSYAYYLELVKRIPNYYISPTAHGFCLAVKRSVIEQYGLFDEIYGLGYGEENDLAMRIREHGYLAAVANRAFVYHFGSRSFGSQKRAKFILENEKILDARYPTYRTLVEEYCKKIQEPILDLEL